LGEFDNINDANDKKNEIQYKMETGKIKPKGYLKVIDQNKNTKTDRGLRKGKYYLIGRPKK
jgi:hypothetical protein